MSVTLLRILTSIGVGVATVLGDFFKSLTEGVPPDQLLSLDTLVTFAIGALGMAIMGWLVRKLGSKVGEPVSTA